MVIEPMSYYWPRGVNRKHPDTIPIQNISIKIEVPPPFLPIPEEVRTSEGSGALLPQNRTETVKLPPLPLVRRKSIGSDPIESLRRALLRQKAAVAPLRKRIYELEEGELEKIDVEDFMCAICLKLLARPVVLKCSHKFCLHCLANAVRQFNMKHCPLCRSELDLPVDVATDTDFEDYLSAVLPNSYAERLKEDDEVIRPEELSLAETDSDSSGSWEYEPYGSLEGYSADYFGMGGDALYSSDDDT